MAPTTPLPSTPTPPLVLVTDAPAGLTGVRVVTLNRPAALNAFSAPLYRAAAAALVAAGAADSGVHLLVLAATGRAFCAGMDVREGGFGGARDEDARCTSIDSSSSGGAPAPPPNFSAARSFMDALRHCPLPIVAAVAGPAVGIGTTLLLHCDVVYATPGSWFWTPFADRGLAPEFGSSTLGPSRLRRGAAAELLILGRRFDAPAAVAAGLVTALIEPLYHPREGREGGGGTSGGNDTDSRDDGAAVAAAVVARLAVDLAGPGVGPWLRDYKRLLAAGGAGEGADPVTTAIDREFDLLADRVRRGEPAAAAARLRRHHQRGGVGARAML
ncbi:hypothetical protein MMPV_002139 [Pyropia vietnamensis]